MAGDNEAKLEQEMAKRLEDLFAEGGDESDSEDTLPAGAAKDHATDAAAVEETSAIGVESERRNGESGDRGPMAVQGGVMSDERALRELKATILSMDWEITDEVMGRLIEQIQRVKAEHGQNRSIFLLLKVLGSLSKYIQVNKSRAHPSAINVLKSVYNGIEQISLDVGDEAQQKQIVVAEIQKFKDLKAQIAKAASGVPSAVAVPAAQPPARNMESSTDQWDALRAVVREVVRQELAELKGELLAAIRRR